MYKAFSNEPVIQPDIDVARKIDTRIRKVVLLLATQRFAGLKVESLASVEHLGVNEHLDVGAIVRRSTAMRSVLVK